MHTFSSQQLKAIKRAYYACITHIDYSLGLLFLRLREEELLDNTWIIFTSDHGDMMGDHHMGAKFTYTEGSAHVPFIIKPPKNKLKEYKGKIMSTLTQLCDIYPSILDMLGIKKDENLDGRSIFDLLKDTQDRPFFGNCENITFCAMRNNVKYIINIYRGAELLFDLNDDPYEQKNLVKNKKYAQQLDMLRQDVINKVEKHSKHLLIDGKLIIYPEMQEEDISKCPGFHSTKLEEVDVLH